MSVPTGSVQGPHEKRLLRHLLSDYNVLERPVANESEPIVVSFGLSLQQIIDVVSISGGIMLAFIRSGVNVSFIAAW